MLTAEEKLKGNFLHEGLVGLGTLALWKANGTHHTLWSDRVKRNVHLPLF